MTKYPSTTPFDSIHNISDLIFLSSIKHPFPSSNKNQQLVVFNLYSVQYHQSVSLAGRFRGPEPLAYSLEVPVCTVPLVPGKVLNERRDIEINCSRSDKMRKLFPIHTRVFLGFIYHIIVASNDAYHTSIMNGNTIIVIIGCSIIDTNEVMNIY